MRNIYKALLLIKKWEGFRAHAYQDQAGVWTIGYGTTIYPNGQRVYPQDTIHEHIALQFLNSHVNEKVLPILDKILEVPINDNQYSALVSFGYNAGMGAVKKSTLIAKLNAEDWFGAAREFDRWVWAGGKVSKGLVRRRAEERALFEHPVETVIAREDPVDAKIRAKKPRWSKLRAWWNGLV